VSDLSKCNEQVDDTENNDVAHDDKEGVSGNFEEAKFDDERWKGLEDFAINIRQLRLVLEIGLWIDG
jgi:hypothetical protein